MTLPARIVASVLCLAGIFAAVQLRAHDRDARLAPARFADQYTLTSRRPDVATSLALAPSGDFASDLVADATLRDVTLPANLRGLDPKTRMAWIDAVPRYDEQLARAGDLMLDAIAERPGWPYHQALLGQLTFARAARNLSPDLVTKYERWSVPLYEGAQSAGTDDGLWESLALAYLQTWPDLGRVHGQNAKPIFQRAFSDPEFVRAAFGPAIQMIGEDQAIASLPNTAKPLHEAFVILAQRGKTQPAWTIHQRWDRAEWNERVVGLRAIEERLAFGDIDTARVLCFRWAEAHPARDYASPAAFAQIRHVLQIWPPVSGTYPGDPRGEMLRYLTLHDAVDEPTFHAVTFWVSGLPASLRRDAAAAARVSDRQDEGTAVSDDAREAQPRGACTEAQLNERRRQTLSLAVGKSATTCAQNLAVEIDAASAPVIVDVMVDQSRVATVFVTNRVTVPLLAGPRVARNIQVQRADRGDRS